MNGDGEDSVRAAGVRVHEGLSRLALDAALLQDLVDLLLAVHLHLLQTLQVSTGTVLQRQHMRLFPLLQYLINLLTSKLQNYTKRAEITVYNLNLTFFNDKLDLVLA